MTRFNKISWALLVGLLVALPVHAQQFVYSTAAPLSATGAGTAIAEFTGASVHTINWTTTGSPTGCTIQLETSTTATGAFSLVGAAQTCTSSGSYTLSGSTANFYRVNLTTLSGGTNPTVAYTYFGSPNSTTTFTDGTFFVPETACSGATSGTAGSGNATDIVAGSGGARVFRLSATNAGASANTFTCIFQVPSRLTAGKGATITDITFLVSTQTTQPTSITLPTLKSFTAPQATDPETANSATFSTAGGTITQTPTSAQFAAYTAVSAGQFYTVKASLGTPILVNNDLQVFQFVIVFNQSASAASLQETPGFYVHYNTTPI